MRRGSSISSLRFACGRPDVNVLVYAHREETREHPRYAAWLIELAKGAYPNWDFTLRWQHL